VTEPQAGHTNGGLRRFQDHIIQKTSVQGRTMATIITISHWRSTSIRSLGFERLSQHNIDLEARVKEIVVQKKF
jgi:hypothetical protein